MVTATQRPDLQPGMVSVVHTAGDLLGFHPHVHAIASRGGWDTDGEWVPVPFVGTGETERLFRHRVIALLRDEDLLSDERIELEPNTGKVLYQPKPTHGSQEPRAQIFEPEEFLARLLQDVPEPRLHQIRYYGRYSNLARSQRCVADSKARPAVPPHDEEPDTAERRRLREAWAQLIRWVYEVDPLICQDCGGEMRVLTFILDSVAIHKILTHLARQSMLAPRGPPAVSAGRVRAVS